ncbi:MAG: glycosyltransferase family 2 protein [Lachnospiraceae bacterium]|nr:glycosyltransferase family 2 protein [Lachnospiraceae bacterium]
MKSTIVIPNYNGIQYIENCLNSLKTESANIIVVDNASSDGSYELIGEKFPEVETVRFKNNTGFCKAVNKGIELADTEYVIFLNNDTVVEQGFVKELERIMDKDDKIFSASAKMISMHEPDKIDDAGDLYCALGWAFAIGKGKPEKEYNKCYSIFAACGGAAIYRRSILDKIGLLDENHFAYLEDIDLGYRAQINGYRSVFAPKARVYHAGSAASGSRYNAFKADLTAKNSIYIIYKNMPFLQIILNLPFLLIGFSVKTLFFIKKGLGGVYVKGLIKGFKLSVSAEGRQHKIRYQKANFSSYCRIQLLLWANVIKRFIYKPFI